MGVGRFGAVTVSCGGAEKVWDRLDHEFEVMKGLVESRFDRRGTGFNVVVEEDAIDATRGIVADRLRVVEGVGDAGEDVENSWKGFDFRLLSMSLPLLEWLRTPERLLLRESVPVAADAPERRRRTGRTTRKFR